MTELVVSTLWSIGCRICTALLYACPPMLHEVYSTAVDTDTPHSVTAVEVADFTRYDSTAVCMCAHPHAHKTTAQPSKNLALGSEGGWGALPWGDCGPNSPNNLIRRRHGAIQAPGNLVVDVVLTALDYPRRSDLRRLQSSSHTYGATHSTPLYIHDPTRVTTYIAWFSYQCELLGGQSVTVSSLGGYLSTSKSVLAVA